MPATFATDDLIAAVKDADVILSLDWVDLGGTFKACGMTPSATVIQVSLDQNLHNGWSMDYEGLPPVDLFIPAEPDATVARWSGPSARAAQTEEAAPVKAHPLKPQARAGQRNGRGRHGERAASRGRRPHGVRSPTCRCHGTANSGRSAIRSTIVGSDGGGGVGGGPGISVGAALALKGTRPPADRGLRRRRLHDGHAPRCGLRCITASPCCSSWPTIARSTTTRCTRSGSRSQRNRPVDNKWIGQRIADPDIDIGMRARGQGAKGFGPAHAGELEKALEGSHRRGRRRRRRRRRRAHPRRLQSCDRRGDGPRQGRSRH